MANTSINSNPSERSLLTKFFYQTVCTICVPRCIRINQAINQQIATDLLYPYDPLQFEVGEKQCSNFNYRLIIISQWKI
jgi:hypothetical protein